PGSPQAASPSHPPSPEPHQAAPARLPSEAPEAPRARRQWRPSAALRRALDDVLPEGPSRLFHRLDAATNQRIDEAEHVLPSSSKSLPQVILHVHEKIRTLPNAFGLSRTYRRRPVGRIPDAELPLDRCTDVPAPRPRRMRRAVKDIIYPYPNISAFLIGRWHEKGSEKKTLHERQELQKVILDPRFNRDDLRDVDFVKIDRLLAEDVQSPLGGSGWGDNSVTIDIPTGYKDTKHVKQQRRQDAMNAQR
ncbi:uncharacterized protein SCHCODRAFT_02473045, partial [Schizophyllum commune H4-8]|uniref:uncharacterized protein n=1 Tax=Schizophyllum commune (strain H4-8 / FGSC 9210) TaxID=578458 RepID=UPI0021602C2D